MNARFDFYRTPEIVFGPGQLKRLPEIILKCGKSILLVTGISSFRSTEHWDRLSHSCKDHKIELFQEVCGTEPSPQLVDDIKDRHREHKIDAVLAIGGGSVLDCGKAVSAMLGKEGSVTDYLEGVGSKTPDGTKVPF
ncbi:MAG: iron-containing alcohol dehydrogenase, partial [Desulfobacteraceae bacterium]|nr:iron-containing alcohol dehydrogenase [Desulfobacteraceae bacterium]